jgi:hypothetical protein
MRIAAVWMQPPALPSPGSRTESLKNDRNTLFKQMRGMRFFSGRSKFDGRQSDREKVWWRLFDGDLWGYCATSKNL